MKYSVTHPYKIHPEIQKELDKKTLLEKWMAMINDGKDPRGLLENVDDKEQIAHQIKIMDLLMKDEDHIVQRSKEDDLVEN